MSEHPPLCVPGAARAHLELVVEPAHRRTRTLYAVLCDAETVPVLHVVVDDLPAVVTEPLCRQAITVLTEALTAGDPRGWLLVGLTRPGSAAPSACDRLWAAAARAATRAAGAGLVGVYVLTPGGCFEVPRDAAA